MREAGRRSRTVSYIYRAAEVIARAIGRPNPLTETAIERHLNTRPGLPLTVFRNLTPQELARALESSRKLRGVDFIADESRTYPEGRLAAHLIGSTRLESPQQASDRKEFFYYVPDPIGREGLERAFDRIPDGGEDPAAPLGLRGRPGYSLVQVDHLGFIRQSLIEKIEPRHGNNLILTLDSRAQQIAESLIDGERAALVLLDASNGDVLAAASSPGYDLGRFTPVLTPGYYRSLLDNPDRPLINRALFEIYPPGSILKPLVALAFLNSGVDPAEKTNCDGGTPIGNASIRCASWRYGGHGPLDMVGALAHSCNDYMVEHALKIGFEPIAAMLDSAGIGRKPGLNCRNRAASPPATVTSGVSTVTAGTASTPDCFPSVRESFPSPLCRRRSSPPRWPMAEPSGGLTWGCGWWMPTGIRSMNGFRRQPDISKAPRRRLKPSGAACSKWSTPRPAPDGKPRFPDWKSTGRPVRPKSGPASGATSG